MVDAGLAVSQDCIDAFNDLKMHKKYRSVVLKLSEDYKQIMID